jgi:hypothetical protein
VRLARLGEGEPVLPRDALLPFDHQRQAHPGILWRDEGRRARIRRRGDRRQRLPWPASWPTCSAWRWRRPATFIASSSRTGAPLALVPPDYVEPPSDTLLGFLVDDVEAATAELAAKGIEPGRRAERGLRVPLPHFQAPDGRRFELLDRRL